ncbi:MAG: type II toxin-antitoxin system VapB family antitoxin [Chloroflexi bacterium]|nr:type II toxin-antitoxin system VapB family antitoxin [Chloroflexota bacterium]
MGLNIEDAETLRLAEELAMLTGETVTAAVTQALSERLERVRLARKTNLAEQLLEIGRYCAVHMREPFRSIDHGELLYDERGLPRGSMRPWQS